MPSVSVELLSVPDCPLVGRIRDALAACLPTAGVRMTERVGEYASPTLLVEGTDVVTGAKRGELVCCRLDVATEEQIRTALSAAARRWSGGRIRSRPAS